MTRTYEPLEVWIGITVAIIITAIIMIAVVLIVMRDKK